jgi:MFS family permease
LPRWNRLLADTGPLRESPAFRRLWAGTTLSSVGGALTGFAVILQVYDLTKSPFAVGAVGVAEMAPTLAVGLLGGSVADAADRRKLVLVTSSCLAAVSAAFAVQAFAGAAAAGDGLPGLPGVRRRPRHGRAGENGRR